MKKIKNLILLIVAMVIASCGGDKVSHPDYPNFSSVYDSTIKNCANSGCHVADATGDGVVSGPDLSTIEKAYANLVGKKASSFTGWKAASGDCKTATLVVASGATTSLALAVVKEDYSINFATASGIADCVPSFSVHSENNALPSDTSALEKWIADGAKK